MNRPPGFFVLKSRIAPAGQGSYTDCQNNNVTLRSPPGCFDSDS